VEENYPALVISRQRAGQAKCVVVAAVFTGLIPYPVLKDKVATEQAEPLTMALEYVGASNWVVFIVAFGSVIAHTAVLLVFQLGQPRIFFAMARDGLLPPVFAHVHSRFRTPYFATILTGVFVATFAAFASIDEMVDLTNIGTLFAFILVCTGILILRQRDPDRPRPFRVPGGPILPVLGIIGCVYLVYYLPPTSWLRFAAWLNLGLVIYVGYGVIHSHLTGRHLSDRPADHDALTARAGLGLAVLGIVMLLFMQVLTLGLAAREEIMKDAIEEGRVSTLSEEFQGAMHAIRQDDNWLDLPGLVLNELFWFLVLPLALNAFILCPIIIRRALRARRGGAGEPTDRNRTILGATGLAVGVGVYFAFLAWYNLKPPG
jgi:hypothetical protein